MTRRQCKHCPWKVGTDPREIPNGYDEQKHRDLVNTIATDISVSNTMRLMACHKTQVGKELPCVGWLANQLGPGNNISLRLAVRSGRISADYELDGQQHRSLEDTFPKRRRRARSVVT